MNKKRLAREFCFQYLFHLQLPIFKELKSTLSTSNSRDALLESISEFKETANTLLDDDLNSFILKQIEGTIRHSEEIDEILGKYLKNWTVPRLPKVDHTTLLLATFELCFENETPVNIIINEAIELSKKFGNLESTSFVNGVLDNIAKYEKPKRK